MSAEPTIGVVLGFGKSRARCNISLELKRFAIEFLNPDKKEWVRPFEWLGVVRTDFEAALVTVDAADVERLIKGMAYKTFLSTRYWNEVRGIVAVRDKQQCRDCQERSSHWVSLEVHHLTYEHHGLEHLHLEDLITLCPVCHALREGHEVDAILSEYHIERAKAPLGIPDFAELSRD